MRVKVLGEVRRRRRLDPNPIAILFGLFFMAVGAILAAAFNGLIGWSWSAAAFKVFLMELPALCFWEGINILFLDPCTWHFDAMFTREHEAYNARMEDLTILAMLVLGASFFFSVLVWPFIVWGIGFGGK